MLTHYRHVLLDAQIVDLVRLGFLDYTHQIAGICKIAIVQTEIGFCNVRVLVDMADMLGLKGAGAALDAMHIVAFSQQQIRQVGVILTGDIDDKCDFWMAIFRRHMSAASIFSNSIAALSTSYSSILRFKNRWVRTDFSVMPSGFKIYKYASLRLLLLKFCTLISPFYKSALMQ